MRSLQDMKSNGLTNHSNANEIINKLSLDMKELKDRYDNVDKILLERTAHLEKLHSDHHTERIVTDDDLIMKKNQIHEIEKTHF
jgi:hypothetical protein